MQHVHFKKTNSFAKKKVVAKLEIKKPKKKTWIVMKNEMGFLQKLS